ncbi:MAG: DUF6261 family protein [Prevotellaceae bacterium]|jgi:hypothetical protein|nr:DUF6261 family protein [Prevotellaceae bacterium]
MELLLNRPRTSRFSTSNHLGFHRAAYEICEAYAPAIDAAELIAAYAAAIAEENTSYCWGRRSNTTGQKAAVDYARDTLIALIGGVVRLSLKHFDPSVRDRARKLQLLLKGYGPIRHLNYSAETVAIDSLVEHLQSAAYLPAVQSLSLAERVAELADQNARFKSLLDAAAAERLRKPTTPARRSRQATDDALRRITDRVAALATVGPAEPLAAFIDNFNLLVRHYNTLMREHYGRLHARMDVAAATIATIAPQPYTGKPVNVIPTVVVAAATTVGDGPPRELAFTVDFTVAYRDNVERGTATLFVYGVGRYTGSKTTTFNIV